MNNIKEAFKEYSKPSVAVDTVILRASNTGKNTKRQIAPKQLQVLLVRKYGEDKWHLPGTIVRLGETSIDAISRIINTDNITFEQLYTIDNDLERDERGHIISIVYIGMCRCDSIKANEVISDIYESQWFWVTKNRLFLDADTLNDTGSLMYDHNSIIDDTINRLKGKLLYSDIGFNFIGEKFTIKDLENTYNAINERQIPGFRRIIANKISGTGIMNDGNAFRPAELFTKKENAYE